MQSSIDKILFRYYDGETLAGLFILHVENVLYARTKIFRKNVVTVICDKLKVGSQGIGCLKFIGLEVTHHGKHSSKRSTGSVSEIP